MSLQKILGNGEKINELSVIKDPFKIDCITDITISYYKTILTETPKFTGSVKFTNGNTSGKQEFEGSDLVDVFLKIKKFCESL